MLTHEVLLLIADLQVNILPEFPLHHFRHSKDEYYSHCLNLLRCILASLEMNAITLKILIIQWSTSQDHIDTTTQCHMLHIAWLSLTCSPLTQTLTAGRSHSACTDNPACCISWWTLFAPRSCCAV